MPNDERMDNNKIGVAGHPGHRGDPGHPAHRGRRIRMQGTLRRIPTGPISRHTHGIGWGSQVDGRPGKG